MQTVYTVIEGGVCRLDLPDPHEEVLSGVLWGTFDELMTPAYWRTQAWQHQALGTYDNLRLGRTLAEEIAACLLGGYGMPAELGLAAYSYLRSLGYLTAQPTAFELEEALLQPLPCNGALRNYRFPRQKAKYLSACLARVQSLEDISDDIKLREHLSQLPGVGLKTASWIVRNYRSSNSVAIIDIHILRAGRYVKLFNEIWRPERHYYELEAAFLSFAEAIETPASILDGLMWDQMRRMPAKSPPKAQPDLPFARTEAIN
jgi:thermostable 8-oxoguanine DNA glycosylase